MLRETKKKQKEKERISACLLSQLKPSWIAAKRKEELQTPFPFFAESAALTPASTGPWRLHGARRLKKRKKKCWKVGETRKGGSSNYDDCLSGRKCRKQRMVRGEAPGSLRFRWGWGGEAVVRVCVLIVWTGEGACELFDHYDCSEIHCGTGQSFRG